MTLAFNKNDVMNSVVKHLKESQYEIFENAFKDAIDAGFLQVRLTDPVLIQEAESDKVKLAQSVKIDYLGHEKLEEYQKKIDEQENTIKYMAKINGELHDAITKFYADFKPNQWLKRGADGSPQA